VIQYSNTLKDAPTSASRSPGQEQSCNQAAAVPAAAQSAAGHTKLEAPTVAADSKVCKTEFECKLAYFIYMPAVCVSAMNACMHTSNRFKHATWLAVTRVRLLLTVQSL
jgi:hypothetical protein